MITFRVLMRRMQSNSTGPEPKPRVRQRRHAVSLPEGHWAVFPCPVGMRLTRS